MTHSRTRSTAQDHHTEVVETDRHQIILNIPPRGPAKVTWRRRGSSRVHTFTHANVAEVKRYFQSACRALSKIGPTQAPSPSSSCPDGSGDLWWDDASYLRYQSMP